MSQVMASTSLVAGTNGKISQQTTLGTALQSNGCGSLANNSPPSPPSSQEAVGGAPNEPQIHPHFLLADLLDQLRECAERFRMQMQHKSVHFCKHKISLILSPSITQTVAAARSSQFGEWRHRFEANVTIFFANNANGIERRRQRMKEGKKKPNQSISSQIISQ
jgi:hypothetical protein